jgi:cation:H+ antiporter
MVLDFFLLIFGILVVTKGADFTITYASELARYFHISKHTIGFLVIAIISVLPETFISIISALNGTPALGLGTLFGSNVADLTFVFSLILLLSSRSLKIETKILKMKYLYLAVMAIPLLFGLDGSFERIEGVVLLIVGFSFYYWVLRENKKEFITTSTDSSFPALYVLYLFLGMFSLLMGAYISVKYGILVAKSFSVNPILIGIMVIGLGTTLPELVFSLRAVRKNHDGLALGDILGTVITDAVIIVGLIAVLSPFSFNPQIIYVTGAFMFFATLLLFHFMKTGRSLTKKEGALLFLFYLLFVIIEFFINT